MSSPSPAGGQAGPSNVVTTLALALCAVGLTAAVYWTNTRAAPSPARGTKGRRSGEDGGRYGTGVGGRGAELSPRGGSLEDVAAERAATEAALSTFRGGGASTVAASVRQALPLRNYFTRCAERHVRRHTANLVEWFDDHLGVRIPFSPILFAVDREERQAPLVLLSLRSLRQEEHHIAITIEETRRPESSAQYMEASLEKVADCAQVLSTGTTRIGNTPHPQVEYCYVDENNALLYTLAVFLTQERLAVTVQYTAPTRVRSIVPTAFHELIRSIRFTPPKVSPSYLLVSEPRLGFGMRLPLDFTVADSVSAALQQRLLSSDRARSGAHHSEGADATHALTGLFQRHTRSQGPTLDGLAGAVGDVSPFMVAVNRGACDVMVIALHEPCTALPPITSQGSSPTSGSGATGTAPQSGTRWMQCMERHVHSTMMRLGLRITGQADASSGTLVMPRLRAKDETTPPLDSGRNGAFTVRPYRVRASLGGNFTSAEEEEDGASGDTSVNGHAPSSTTLHGSFFVEPAYVTRGSLGAALLSPPTAGDTAGDSVPIFWSCFFLSVGGDCVAVHVIAPCAQYPFQNFVELSTSTVNSISLGNHYGQGTTATYCSLRHELLPFTLTMRISAHETVEEPFLGDPLSVVRTWLPQQHALITVLLRTFPVVRLHGSVSGTTTPSTQALGPRVGPSGAGGGVRKSTTGSRASRPPRRRSSARVLEHMIRTFLAELPEEASICQWERTTVNGLPALRFCYTTTSSTVNGVSDIAAPVASTYTDDGNVDAASVATSEWLSSRALTLEEEVGSMNPLSTYYKPPPPPASYLGHATPTTTDSGASAARDSKGGPPTRKPSATAAGTSSDRDTTDDELDEETQAPVRVAVALCYANNQAMLFSAGADTSLWPEVAEAVLGVASRFTASAPTDT